MSKKTVCVDLDGVLATYDHWRGVDHIGEVRPGAVEFMKKLRETYRVVVFTTRCKLDMPDRGSATEGDLVRKVGQWLTASGIEYDEIYSGQGKPIAVAYLDDRAVGITSNPHEGHFAHALTRIRELAG